MSVISFSTALHGNGDVLINKTAETLSYKSLNDDYLIEAASNRFQVDPVKLRRAMTSSPSVFNKFTHEKEKNVAYLRAAMSEIIQEDNFIFHGYGAHLIPKSLTHVLRVCLLANLDYRVEIAMKATGLSAKESESAIKKDDTEKSLWTQYLFELGPWDKSLYDIIIPMHSTTIDVGFGIIKENIEKPVLRTTEASIQAINDFKLATAVNMALVEKGHDVEVSCKNGIVTIVINKYVLRLDQLEKKLEKIAAGVPDVNGVNVKTGSKFHQPNIYINLDVDVPRKILLVDDEKDFVHTLSERLQSRDMESAVAYNGEEALSIIDGDEPEVMVLDLKMPGIDGIEVLRQTKKSHPNTEIIILTGHGSEKEEALARELGAFAYLHKPVDIDVLTKTMKEAYKKIQDAKSRK